MSKFMRYSVLLALPLLLITTGCASKKQTKKEISGLQAQVAALTDEVVRLDQSLQEARGGSAGSASVAQPSPVAYASAGSGPMYRTPSGFEVPAMDIQRALKNAGYYQGTVDGKIGAQSEAAIKAFQKDNDLEADGICGRNTWAKLKAHLSSSVK
ncbi:MAG: peptidoglycan-binding domain-containing protein [Candidatus Omnitrophota bacterium]|jgi:murein L,D-transpeptidase YcbB/YkuD